MYEDCSNSFAAEAEKPRKIDWAYLRANKEELERQRFAGKFVVITHREKVHLKCICTHVCVLRHPHPCSHMHACTHTYTLSLTNAHMHACTRIHTHTHAHTHHTHTHTLNLR